MTEPYAGGKALLVTCHGCKALDILPSTDGCEAVARLIAQRIGMTPVGPPRSEVIQDPRDPQRCGVSAIQIIAESHVAIHTWPELRGATVLAYSCKHFETAELVAAVDRLLGPEAMELSELVRVGTVTVGAAKRGPVTRYES